MEHCIADSDPDREFYCYSRKIVIMRVKWNLLSKSRSFETHCLLFCSDSRTFLLPGQCGDDEEGIDGLVAVQSA